MTRAILMAGGRSRRMRATRGPEHKTLLDVVGVPVLERNLGYLLAAGFRDLVVVAGAAEAALIEFVDGRLAALAAARGAELTLHVEQRPLGTIGVCGELARGEADLFVMAADNLTSLDPQRLVRHHRESGAALSLATHAHRIRVPYGEVEIRDGRVRRYLEKPTIEVPVCSALYVLSGDTAASIGRDRSLDAPALVERLLGDGRAVAAMEHDAHWIDVNDASTLAAAEQMIRDHPGAFECWQGAPDVEVVAWAARREGHVATRRHADDAPYYPSQLNLPSEVIERGWSAPPETRLIACFDDLDVLRRRVIRHRVVAAPRADLPGEIEWTPLERLTAAEDVAPPLVRAAAYLRVG